MILGESRVELNTGESEKLRLLKEVERAWQGFFKGMAIAEENWDKFRLLGEELTRTGLEEAPLEIQCGIARFGFRAKFDVMLPRFAEYKRKYGVEELISKGERKEG
jgi:hypothetical protein